MTVPEPMREYVIKKMDKLDRYLDRLSRVEVILSTRNTRESSGRSMAEATATAGGRTIRAESVDADIQAAVDRLVDKLHHQLTRAKEKTRDHKHHGREPADVPVELVLGPDDEAVPGDSERSNPELQDQIVEIKQYTLKPMFSDEAIEEMNELGHTFFVFLNARTEKVTVVYRRRDGLYGLIEPAFA